MTTYIACRDEQHETYGDCVAVDAVAECGSTFRGVAYIVEPDGPAPMVVVPKPLGWRSVMMIADIAKRKEGR